MPLLGGASYNFVFGYNLGLSVRLQQIHALVTISETGSIRAAARKLGISQPALSKSILQLEDEFSVAVVQRTPRGVNLTPYGRAMLVRARSIAADMERMREEIEQMRGTLEGVVSIATAPSPAALLLPEALKRFRSQMPNIQVRVRESVYPETLRLLREGVVDIAMSAQPQPRASGGAEFRSDRLYGNALTIACRYDHPKANARSLVDLLDCDWLLHGPADGPGTLFAPVFRANGLAPPVPKIQSDSFTASIHLIEHSDVMCVQPERLIRHLERERRVRALRLSEAMPSWDVYLVTRAGTPLTPAAQALATCLRRTPPKA